MPSLLTTLNGTTQRWLVVIALCLAVFLPRLLTLGSILTIDEPLWQGRGITFIKGVATAHFDQTLVAGQPGVTTSWLAGLTYRWHSLAANQAAVGVATGILILVITYFVIQIGGWWWGLLVGFWLALDPFGLAYSRVIHTDALLAFSYLASLAAILAALAPAPALPIKRYLVISGVLGALAVLTKLFAVILIPTVGLLLLVAYWRQPRVLFSTILWWGLSALITALLLWPALWSDTTNVFNYLTGRVEMHAGGTRDTDITAHWWYYLRELWYHSSLLTTVGVLFGIVGLIWRPVHSLRRVTLIILAAGIVYLVIMSVSVDKGERYVLFTFLSLQMLAVYGVFWLAARWPDQKATGLLAALAIAGLVLTAWLAHPYYLAYRNPLYPYTWALNHRSGWGEGLEQAATWVQTKRPGAKVAAYYPRVFSYFYKGDVDSITHLPDTNADLVVLYRGMLERAPNTPEADITHEYLNGPTQPIHIISLQGLPYVWIYERHP